MNELQEEIDAIGFASDDELGLTLGVGWRTFLKILVPMLPLIVLCAIPPAVIISFIPFDEITQRLNLSDMDALKLQLRIEQLVTLPFSTVVFITAMVASVRAMARNRLGLWADFATAMRRVLPVIGTSFLVFLSALGFSFALIVSMRLVASLPPHTANFFAIALLAAFLVVIVAYAVKVSFCLASAVVGGTSGTGALRESMGLVRGRWWQTFGLLFVIAICSLLLQMPAILSGVCEGRLMTVTDNLAVLTIADAVTIALGFTASLFAVSAITVLYLMRRSRLMRQAAEAPFGDSQFGDDEVQPSDFRQ